MVGKAALFGFGRFGSADIHVAVHLHGIHGDDFTVKPVGKLKGKCCLANGSGADQDNNRRVNLHGSIAGKREHQTISSD